ncbi:MAG: recombinase family protein [Candidatus Nanoarchaeia archaeon]|nr:recombinase family protein [Candidatus Nanoarchaeia archaeon]
MIYLLIIIWESRRIAKYLNDKEIESRNNKQFSYSTINYILNNPTYKGILHMYSQLYDEQYISKTIEKLIIIPEDRWNLNQTRIKGRQNKHNNTRNQSIPTASRVLLSGLVYCGHCGTKMGVWANHKHYKNAKGEMVKVIYDTYKCRGKIYSNEKKCDGQTTYSAKKIDIDIEDQVEDFIVNISKNQLSKAFIKQLDDNIKNIKMEINKTSQQIIEINEQIEVLKNEVPKALLGKSKFNTDLLQDLLNQKTNELPDVKENLKQLNLELEDVKRIKDHQIKTNKEIENWNEVYRNASLEKKKMLISEVVDRVYLFRDEVKIKFKITNDLYETYGSVKD